MSEPLLPFGNQRWRERRHLFRRPDEQIRPSEYDVAPLGEEPSKDFVRRHHYSGSYPAARWRFGLFHKGTLAGVAVFSHPCHDAVLTGVFGAPAVESVELGRFVLLDEVPGNGETWFLARCLHALRKKRLRGLVSFSDPLPRDDLGGRLVFPGHVGTIYQASNARYLGRSRSRWLLLLPDGSLFSERTRMKIQSGARGWQYACRQLGVAGADDPFVTVGRLYPDLRSWLAHWLPRLTRRRRHPGNHKYAWPLVRPGVTLYSLPYPKKGAIHE